MALLCYSLKAIQLYAQIYASFLQSFSLLQQKSMAQSLTCHLNCKIGSRESEDVRHTHKLCILICAQVTVMEGLGLVELCGYLCFLGSTSPRLSMTVFQSTKIYYQKPKFILKMPTCTPQQACSREPSYCLVGAK